MKTVQKKKQLNILLLKTLRNNLNYFALLIYFELMRNNLENIILLYNITFYNKIIHLWIT
jgi:hypothetical protein